LHKLFRAAALPSHHSTQAGCSSTVNNSQGLKNVQWTYLGVACFVELLLILFFLAPMPEITHVNMGTQEIEIAGYA
jgi:FHS family L-fucose permease-like MFS transporter